MKKSKFSEEQIVRILKEVEVGAKVGETCRKHGIANSTDGNGCWRDNVFVERLWKSIKYEEVYLRAYDSVSHAKTSLGSYIEFYNTRRPHSALERHTPDQVYFNLLPLPMAA